MALQQYDPFNRPAEQEAKFKAAAAASQAKMAEAAKMDAAVAQAPSRRMVYPSSGDPYSVPMPTAQQLRTAATAPAPASAIARPTAPAVKPAAKTADKPDGVIQPMPKRADYGLGPEGSSATLAMSRDRTGNSDPAVQMELARNRAAAKAANDAKLADNKAAGEKALSNLALNNGRGYNTSVAARAQPAAQDAEQFAPGAELYNRAQRFLAASQEADDGTFGGMVKAAIARNTAKRLLAASEGFTREQGDMARAGMRERGETSRTQMRNESDMERTQLTEAGALRRAEIAGQNDINRARIAAQGTMANTQLQQQLALDAKLQEMAAKEGLKSTEVETLYKQALAGNANADQMLKLQKYGVFDAAIQQPGIAPSRAASIVQTGRDPALEANKDAALAVIKGNPATNPEQFAAAMEYIRRMQAGNGQGYAAGGMVNPPMGAPTMGMPDIKPQIQLVQDYRNYAAAAAKLGATPIPFDQFTNMKMMQAQPAAGFAYGGIVEPMPEAPMQFANGGAINVAGRQVLGAGTGKSDSIPAIIDGEKPAALSTGEFVMPVEAVRHFGLDRLNKMVEAARNSSSK